MSTTHSTRTVLLVGVVTALVVIASGCSSSTGPGPASTTSSMAMDTNGAAGAINRSDPTAVATAFATYFAAGDTPSACKLASQDGIKQINDNWGASNGCTARQPWSTTVNLRVHCAASGNQVEYLFRTSGADEINTSTYLDVLLARTGGEWQVTTAGGLASSASPLPCQGG